MDGRSGDSSSEDPQSSSGGGRFECNICFDPAQEPVVTLCGHLFCWPCLYEWLHDHSCSSECPVCKATIDEEEIVPLYGGGTNSAEPQQSRSSSGMDIPDRPPGRRTTTATQNRQPGPNPIHRHNLNHNHHHHPRFINPNQWAGMGLTNLTPAYAVTNQLPPPPPPPHYLAGASVGNFMFLNTAANDVTAVLHRGYNNELHSLQPQAQGFQHGQGLHGWHPQWVHQGHGHHHHGIGHVRRANRGQSEIWIILLIVLVALVFSDIVSKMPL
ncbi:uncharacterized protein LOC122032457 [Zingiber officinale]|uniref:uncharacterized protein LOC122032457 n=1 Tax=Zingiber officinale TaxID=94328 RepID=UPI001C4D5166|nr:uncharacterized protein LOC122032457 [Zingiber officinale]XP_042447678.1 uncharacterized protein LOC122032457 [Zingiber officinale]